MGHFPSEHLKTCYLNASEETSNCSDHDHTNWSFPGVRWFGMSCVINITGYLTEHERKQWSGTSIDEDSECCEKEEELFSWGCKSECHFEEAKTLFTFVRINLSFIRSCSLMNLISKFLYLVITLRRSSLGFQHKSCVIKLHGVTNIWCVCNFIWHMINLSYNYNLFLMFRLINSNKNKVFIIINDF